MSYGLRNCAWRCRGWIETIDKSLIFFIRNHIEETQWKVMMTIMMKLVKYFFCLQSSSATKFTKCEPKSTTYVQVCQFFGNNSSTRKIFHVNYSNTRQLSHMNTKANFSTSKSFSLSHIPEKWPCEKSHQEEKKKLYRNNFWMCVAYGEFDKLYLT